MKGSLELPEDHEDDLRIRWIHIIVLLSTVLFLVAYYFSYILGSWFHQDSGFAKFYPFINMQLIYMMSNWQIAFALISILIITLGWTLVKALSVGYIHLQVRRGREFNRIGGILIRYGIAEYFLALLISKIVFSFEFNQLILWVAAGIIFSSLFLITYGLLHWRNKHLMASDTYKEKLEEYKWLGLREKGDDEETIISGKQILYLIIIAVLILSFFMFFPIVAIFWNLIHSDEIIAILFWISILLIWPFWKITSLVLYQLAKIPIYLVRENLQNRVNKMRLYFGIFVLSLFAFANIPYFQNEWGLTDLQTDILSLGLSLFITLFSFYVTRGLKK
ncbi:MAG: hypothetical protein ACFFDB_00250 [Promethearchaeota archaeon]